MKIEEIRNEYTQIHLDKLNAISKITASFELRFSNLFKKIFPDEYEWFIIKIKYQDDPLTPAGFSKKESFIGPINRNTIAYDTHDPNFDFTINTMRNSFCSRPI